jgi:transposase-like protein
MKCPRCNGKIKRKSAKKLGGINQYYCISCHRKYIVDQVKGGLKEI